MKEFIIFDVDRTIYNGSIFLDFSLHLIQKEVISSKFLSTIGFEFVTYQTGFESYDEMVADCLLGFHHEIKDVSLDLLKKEFSECLVKNHEKIYDFAYKIIELQKFEILIISLEPDFMLEEFCKFLKVSNFLGNKFTNDSKIIQNPQLVFNKKEILSNSNFSFINSNQKPFAVFGDSESDIPLLEIAKNPFVVNPTYKLLKEIESGKNLNIFDPNQIFPQFLGLVKEDGKLDAGREIAGTV